MKRLLPPLLCLLALTGPAHADLTQKQLDAVGIHARPGAALPVDAVFRTGKGGGTSLGRLLGGKPALLVFADYTCHTLCGTTVAMASDALAHSGLAASDYRFVVIGIDPKDTQADAAAMKARYLKDGLVGDDAVFLLGSGRAVAETTGAAGYAYAYDREADQFAHPTAAFVLTPGGRISQVLTAIGISSDTVRLALVEAAGGRIGDLSDHLRLLCYGYDPATGRYSGLVLGWLRGLGLATVAALGLLVLLLARRRRDGAAARGEAP